MERGLKVLQKIALWGWAWAAMVSASGLGWSQESEDSPTFPPARTPDVLVPGARPDVYWLKNAQGVPVMVPRIDYEEFERLLVEASGEKQDQPPPALTQLDLLIEPEEGFARVSVDAAVRLPAPNRSWLSVPIGLASIQWLPSNNQQGRSDLVVQPSGYVWRIEPGLSRDRSLRLSAVCKITSSNSGNSIRLDLPPTATVVRLKLPQGEWDLTASGGGTEVVEPFRTIDGHSVAIVRTTANTLNLAWNRKEERQAMIAVEATSQTKFSPSDDGALVKAVTTCSLRGPTSLGGRTFSIALPPNGQVLEPASNRVGISGYRINRRMDVSDQSQEVDSKPWVFDIEIDDSLARAELDIALEWQISGPANPKTLVCDTPTIEGVQSHSGSMECFIPRGIVFQWAPRGDARLIRQGPAADGSNSMVYAFQFASQPAGIMATWQSLLNRPRIRASHQIEVRENEAVLEGRVDFLSDPTQLPLLQLEWSGWRADRVVIQPSMLERDRSSLQISGDGNRVAVPLNASLFIDELREGSLANVAPASGSGNQEGADRATPGSSQVPTGVRSDSQRSFAVEYVLSMPLSPGDDSLRLSLPQLSWLNQTTQQRSLLTPAGILRVQSWMYRFSEVESLQNGLVPMLSSVPVSGTSPAPFRLSYQVGETGELTEWVAKRYRRPSSTSVDYDASPKLLGSSIEWKHRWVCRSYGGRPERLLLGVPVDMQLRDLLVEGSILELQKMETAATSLESRYVWYPISVPRPPMDDTQTADLLITANSDMSLSWDGTDSLHVDVELPILRSAREEDLLVTDTARIRQTDRSNEGEENREFQLDPERPRWETMLAKSIPVSERDVEIEAEWVQTILNAIYQRDRYVVRFATDREWIDLDVPSSLRKEIEIVLDGRRVAFADVPGATDKIRIDLPPKNRDDRYVLEIFSLRPGPEGLLRRIYLNAPRLSSKKSAAPLIWQVIMPRTEHLVWSSAELAPLYRWEWKDLFFARSSERTQQRMEAELGATKQPEVTLLQINQYDLTTLAGDQVLSAWFVPRSLIWLPVALVILLLSMSLGESSLLKRPWLWSGLLVTWLICSQWSWDISVLLAQTVLAAMGLAVTYGLLRWVLNRRARRRSIFVSRSTSVAIRSHSKNSNLSGAGSNVKESSSKSASTHTAGVQVLEEGS
jgi:hypothetical protein